MTPESFADTFADNDYFRIGAAVAIGELYCTGRLGDKSQVANDTRLFLSSFGLNSVGDIRNLGVTGPYLDDFTELYETCES